MSNVVFENVSKAYADLLAVNDVNFRINSGEFVTLLGPSGCGKTTCLRMIAGFVAPTSGKIQIGDIDVTAMPPHRRNTGMVFQSYALFPNYTVAGNVAFGLKVRRLNRSEIEKRTLDVLRLVKLDSLAERYPSQLSGGQKQRVALARAIVINPGVMLLDEPLAALDLKLREELQIEIKKIQKKVGITTMFVTHDQGEALRMSDRVAVMQNGKILQMDTPDALYRRPNSLHVAQFVGSTNLIAAQVAAIENLNSITVALKGFGDPTCRVLVEGDHQWRVGEKCTLGIRPEDMKLTQSGENNLIATVTDVSYSGANLRVDFQEVAGRPFFVTLSGNIARPTPGEKMQLFWRSQDCFLLPAAQ